MTERMFWQAIRAALLAMVAAIDRRYKFGKYAKSNIVEVSGSDPSTSIS